MNRNSGFSRSSRPNIRKYHHGWVYVKTTQSYRQLYALLCAGKEIRFYADEANAGGQGGRCEFSVSLRGLGEVQLMSDKRQGSEFPEFMVVLKFQTQQPDVKMRFQTHKERGAWARFLRAAGLGQLPQNTTHLLPGQIHEMQDIISEEQRHEIQNMESQTHDGYLPMNPMVDETQQPWFYPTISRTDAEHILSGNTGFGNMLVRRRQKDEGNDEYDFAVSAKLQLNATEQFKHYRVKWCSDTREYKIYLAEGPHPRLETLEAVIGYFESSSKGKYRRITVATDPPPHAYELHIFSDSGPVYENQIVPGRGFPNGPTSAKRY